MPGASVCNKLEGILRPIVMQRSYFLSYLLTVICKVVMAHVVNNSRWEIETVNRPSILHFPTLSLSPQRAVKPHFIYAYSLNLRFKGFICLWKET